MALDQNPLISVIMPVKNGGTYLQQAIDSIIQQTYSHFELIIIEDGVGPETHQQLIQQKDQRICLVKNTNCKGIPGALNTGIQQAKGQYIARMDADDISFPGRFQKQFNHLKNTKCDICGTWLKTKQYPFLSGKTFRYPDNIEDIYFSLLYGTAIAHPTIMATKEIMQNYCYNTQYPVASDYDVWTRMAADEVHISNLTEVLYEYRIHSNRVSETNRLKQEAIATQIADNYAKKYLPDNLYALSSKLNHGRNACYSFGNAKKLAKAILEFAQHRNINPSIKAGFLLQLAYRLRPFRLTHFYFIRELSWEFNLPINHVQKLKFFLQNMFHIERNSNLHKKMKWTI